MNRIEVGKSYLLKRIYLSSFLVAMILSLLYFVFITNINIDWIARYDDMAFERVNQFESNNSYSSRKKILVFEIDDDFLISHNLMDESKLLNREYNDFFPRQDLIEFIEKVDELKPRLLFIDLDLSKRKQGEDDNLIKLLNKDRCYPIYLTHNVNENFIEEEGSGNIRFVSTAFISYNKKVMHYKPFSKKINAKNKTEQKYYFGPLLFSGMSMSAIEKDYDVINSRFIYKDRIKEVYPEKSFWTDIMFFSLEQDILNLNNEYTDDAIIFLGTNHSDNHDMHTIYDGTKKSGVEILANSLASINYFSPQLKLLGIGWALSLMFISVFLICFLSLKLLKNSLNKLEYSFKKRKQPSTQEERYHAEEEYANEAKKRRNLFIFFFQSVIIIVSALISLLVLKVGHFWFSPITSYVLFILWDLVLVVEKLLANIIGLFKAVIPHNSEGKN